MQRLDQPLEGVRREVADRDDRDAGVRGEGTWVAHLANCIGASYGDRTGPAPGGVQKGRCYSVSAPMAVAGGWPSLLATGRQM
ncbi:hypothetical protein GCM10022286_28970 [Gryllotalpicola daejeonensis]|uniref:Uncharacterized protein n=1 Tax=Gryllotalpicola daejeonensis TaxID=993087 RepID=A0ABP7ZN69_9MICO